MNDVERSDAAKLLYREAEGVCKCGRSLLPDLDSRELYNVTTDDGDTRAVCEGCYTRIMFADITANMGA